MKRQQDNSFNNYDDKKRQKVQITTIKTPCLSRVVHTYFEDLSNELIYEIFEFLDNFDVYQGFFNLNTRFRSLLTNSTIPIKINLSFMSKSTLHRYYKDIIKRNKHRTNLLRISNIFMYHDNAFPLFHKITKFNQLKTLILENIEQYYLENLLHRLTPLRFLSSLIITSIFDHGTNTNTIYRQIFQLPAVKYCKLSLETSGSIEPLPVATNEHSPIEYLIINSTVYLNELYNLISYVPQLRHLSLHLLHESGHAKTKPSPIILKHLTHISLELGSITFDSFEQLIINLFPTVQMLRISANEKYMDANRWKQLILYHLPNLRIFDIQLDVQTGGYSRLIIDDQVNQFTSTFWIERQWFIEHQSLPLRYGSREILYSTKPYRRKHYTIRQRQNKPTRLNDYETNLKSVEHLHIQSRKEIINCSCYFPNVTKLTLEDGFSRRRDSVADILTRIIPLNQLTNLVINCQNFSFIKIIDLLYFTPNIHTLAFKSMLFIKNERKPILNNKKFRLVSSTNTITNVTVEQNCSTLEKLQLLVALCPRMQHLTINVSLNNDMESMIRFLLEKPNQNADHLSSLCFLETSIIYRRNLEALIKSGTLADDYMLKLVGSKLYLWW